MTNGSFIDRLRGVLAENATWLFGSVLKRNPHLRQAQGSVPRVGPPRGRPSGEPDIPSLPLASSDFRLRPRRSATVLHRSKVLSSQAPAVEVTQATTGRPSEVAAGLGAMEGALRPP
jgi:hypothetical protein